MNANNFQLVNGEDRTTYGNDFEEFMAAIRELIESNDELTLEFYRQGKVFTCTCL